MSGPKDAANAALSAARRQNATLHGHDDARREIKDLVDRRGQCLSGTIASSTSGRSSTRTAIA